jgi:hypothetical protein
MAAAPMPLLPCRIHYMVQQPTEIINIFLYVLPGLPFCSYSAQIPFQEACVIAMRSICSNVWAGRRRLGRAVSGAALLAFQLAWGAEDPGTRALQQHQLRRQQQEEATQLRQLQQQRSVQSPPAGDRERQDLEKLNIEQQQRQQELHYRQSVTPTAAQPADDEGTRRAKAEMELLRARQQSQQQLRQFERELQDQGGK